jgi:hypothetical protein
MLDPQAIMKVVQAILTGNLSPTSVAALIGAQCAQSYLQGVQDTLERLGIAEAAAETEAAIAKARG